MKYPVAALLDLPHVRAHHTGRLLRKKIGGVSTDSREVRKGDLFIAIRGERFDGHEFIAQALRSGAMIAVADTRWEDENRDLSDNLREKMPVIVVDDTVAFLGLLARSWRRQFDIPVVAVAGSNGKTTTKEMIAAVLAAKYRVLSTKGNLNNQIGVPQTLFRLGPRHEVAVVEIGTNHPGEIEYLLGILEPTHGILSNIGREHLEFFGDLDGVAAEEGRVFTYLRKHGTAFVNADDPRVRKAAKGVQSAVAYGFRARGTVAVRGIDHGLDDRGCGEFSVAVEGKRPYKIKLGVPGMHAMINALAAAAVGMSFRVPQQKIRTALQEFRAVSKRMEIGRVDSITILNDTYNANPDSVLSALETLRAMKAAGKKIVVLGDMRELGEQAEKEHRGIGAAAARLKFDYLLTFGPAARWIHDEAAGVRYRVHYDDQEKLSRDLCTIITPGDTVLVKGSRGMKMEQVVSRIERHCRTSEPAADKAPQANGVA